MTVIAKIEILFVATFGICAWFAGLTFINRRSKKAADAVNAALLKMKEKNVKLWVFPEGD
jgi:1-acyl-sn-glycerol-3-phosphate acyltransferase